VEKKVAKRIYSTEEKPGYGKKVSAVVLTAEGKELQAEPEMMGAGAGQVSNTLFSARKGQSCGGNAWCSACDIRGKRKTQRPRGWWHMKQKAMKKGKNFQIQKSGRGKGETTEDARRYRDWL